MVHNLLILSDVHLGSDLVHHARPDAPNRSDASRRRDRDLVALFDWYRDRRQHGLPWRLVIAGDFVDFVGMAIAADPAEIQTYPTEEEICHGLGGAADHTLAKLRRVVVHHADVFRALAEFVAAGNALVIVRGNHDVDLHWDAVQEQFRKSLREFADIDRGSVEFAPWFYYEEGFIYIEHGHQYDRYCSYDHVLYPVSPGDPRRTARSLSDILVRYVVRPTRGMFESGHADANFLDYMRFGIRLGARGMLALARRFGGAVHALLAVWREHFSDAAHWVRNEHDRKLQLLSEAKQISLERLRALSRLQRPPVTRSLLSIFASVMLDRVVLGVSAFLLVAASFALVEDWAYALLGVLGVAAGALALGATWKRLRSGLEPSAELREQAALIARLFPAAFVVMGHTHLPEVRSAPGAPTYVNLGAWAEEDAEDGAKPCLPATRTHLVLAQEEGRPVAEFLTWDPERGPQAFGSVPSEYVRKSIKRGE